MLETRRHLAAQLVADLDPRTADANVAAFTAYKGDAIFYSANHVYRSDGTATGTSAIAATTSDVDAFAVLGPYAYFVQHTTTASPVASLWRTDGTSAGTVSVKTLPKLTATTTLYPTSLTAANGQLFFELGSPSLGWQLYVSDTASTAPQSLGSFLQLSSALVGYDGATYFGAQVSGGMPALWRTDGTSLGTTLVTATGSNPSATPVANGFTVSDGILFFAGGDSERVPWRSDGTTAGTFPLDVVHDTQPLNPGAFVDSAHGTVFLSSGLYVTDGTSTTRLIDLYADSSFSHTSASLDGVAYFWGYTNATGTHLWRSDGTVEGTVQLENSLGKNGTGGTILGALGDRVLYSAFTATSIYDIYSTDGTVAGTTNLTHTTASGPQFQNQPAVLAGAHLFLKATDPIHGAEPWATDGTAVGTQMLVDSNAAPYSSSPGGPYPGTLVSGQYGSVNSATLDGFTYFGTADGSLWKTDGTSAGTTLVTSIYGGFHGTKPIVGLTAWNGRVYFVPGGPGGGHPYCTDGTAAGTVELSTSIFINVRSAQPFTPFGDALYFTDGSNLYRTQGTPATTVPSAGGGFASMGPVVATSDAIYFTAQSNGVLTVWKSNGTSAATVPLSTISPGFTATAAAELVPVGNLLYFTARPANPTITNDRALYRTDGTDAGTLLLQDNIFSGTDGSSVAPNFFTPMNGVLYFVGAEATHGRELWRSDGRVAGTRIVTDIYPGKTGSEPVALTASGDRLYFQAYTAAAGVEPWVSDGSAAGTHLMKDIYAGGSSSLSSFFGNYLSDGSPFLAGPGDSVFVTAADASTGNELWELDDERGVAFRIADLNSGAASSNARGIAVLPAASGAQSPTLLFSAEDPVHGRELWRLALGGAPIATAPPPVTVDEGQDVTLIGSGTETQQPIVNYQWDFDYSAATGFAIDATSATFTIPRRFLDGPSTHLVALRAIDSGGQLSAVVIATITVVNVAPSGTLTASTSGATVTVGFTGALDPASLDQQAGLLYSFDFNNDGDFDDAGDVVRSTNSSATHTFDLEGTYTVHAQIADKDGGVRDYTTDVVIVVPPALPTFDVDRLTVMLPFSAPLSPESVDPSDLILTNLDTARVTRDAVAASLSADGRWITFTLPATLPDGNYEFRVPAGAVSHADGTLPTQDVVASGGPFFVLAGDLDRDRKVGLSDLLILARSYGQSGKAFGQGNVDYSADGVVDFTDLLALARNYGKTLAAPADVALAASPPTTTTRRRAAVEIVG